MKTLSGNNMATFIPPLATAALPYAYDAGTTYCILNVYDAIYDYDDAGCFHSRTSSTSVMTTLICGSAYAANGACFPDPAGGHEWHPSESGVSCYGYRFYKPQLGRWVNRDPIGEMGGVNVYRFVRNQAVGQWDYLGLQWDAPDRQGGSWATVKGCGGNVVNLAEMLKLEALEYTEWLKPVPSGQPIPNSVEEAVFGTYYVPNTIALYTSATAGLDTVPIFGGVMIVNLFRYGISTIYDNLAVQRGFRVVRRYEYASVSEFKSLWTLDGIYGVGYGGHGTPYGLKVNPFADPGEVAPNEVSPPYKLALIAMYACYSADYIPNQPVSSLPLVWTGDGFTEAEPPKMRWREHLANGGTFIGFNGWVHLFNHNQRKVRINTPFNPQ